MSELKRVFIAGGDGFIGWPLALALSDAGCEVFIGDCLLRRELVQAVAGDTLRPIAAPEQRVAAWRKARPDAGPIVFERIDIATEAARLADLLRGWNVDAVVHLATIPSAPFSMKDRETGERTIRNNALSTWAILNAVIESGVSAPVVHIGTMGVYGYDAEDYDLPEGYLSIEIPRASGPARKARILHPMKPGSLYHLTKAYDQLTFEFYNRQFGLQVTDLHQGIVWGISTALTALDDGLCTRFDYDSDFGTVLNRFAVQAASDIPLTVYGSGGQRRALIHLADSVNCLLLALRNPPQPGDGVRIFNQFAEVLSVGDIARIVSEVQRSPHSSLENPRIEREDNQLRADNEGLKLLGWEPTLLSPPLVMEIVDEARRFRARVNPDVVRPMSFWRKRSNA
jgi:UDP-sulfoquinovose synthase